MRSPPVLLVIWHSQTGATESLVRALQQGAALESTVEVRSLRASLASAADVLGADAVVFATPETLGSMSGQLKDFFDRSYYALLDHCQGKPCALMVAAGSDGRPTIVQLRRVITGLRMREVAEPLLVCVFAQSPAEILAKKTVAAGDLAAASELGMTLSAGLALGVF